MDATAAAPPRVRRGVSPLVVAGAAVIAAALALARIVLADGSVAARGLAVPAVVLAALLVARPWPVIDHRRALALHVAALASLLVAVGALAPTSLAAGLIVAAAIRIGRDVAGWPGLVSVAMLALAHAAGLAVHGADQVAPAAGAAIVGLFVYGMAEPDRGAWCACEWSHHSSINDLDSFYLRRDDRPSRRT